MFASGHVLHQPSIRPRSTVASLSPLRVHGAFCVADREYRPAAARVAQGGRAAARHWRSHPLARPAIYDHPLESLGGRRFGGLRRSCGHPLGLGSVIGLQQPSCLSDLVGPQHMYLDGRDGIELVTHCVSRMLRRPLRGVIAMKTRLRPRSNVSLGKPSGYPARVRPSQRVWWWRQPKNSASSPTRRSSWARDAPLARAAAQHMAFAAPARIIRRKFESLHFAGALSPCRSSWCRRGHVWDRLRRSDRAKTDSPPALGVIAPVLLEDRGACIPKRWFPTRVFLALPALVLLPTVDQLPQHLAHLVSPPPVMRGRPLAWLRAPERVARVGPSAAPVGRE